MSNGFHASDGRTASRRQAGSSPGTRRRPGLNGRRESSTLSSRSWGALWVRHLITLAVLFGALSATAAEVREQRNSTTGLASWKVEDRGFSLELLQVSADFVRAFYGSRGMPPDLVESIAGFCVFGTVARNESQKPLSYRVSDWRYVTQDGMEHPVKTKTQWQNQWGDRGAPYLWSLLPDDQTFDDGDWNQGFTTVAALRGARFDLIYSWSLHGQTYTGKMEGLRCAPAELRAP
jgi:hypothetical protein